MFPNDIELWCNNCQGDAINHASGPQNMFLRLILE